MYTGKNLGFLRDVFGMSGTSQQQQLLADSACRKGVFITLEGGEGAGKSSHLALVREYMEGLGYEVECTREPGGTKLAEQIRSILLTKDDEESLCSTSELLLMYAARAQLVNSKIKPLLEQGKVVISDRFDLSTYAYQGFGRGIDLNSIDSLREVAIGCFRPDLTLLFDVDVEVGMERIRVRKAKDRIEQESLAFFQKVREGFLEGAKRNADIAEIIDANKSFDEVSNAVLAVLQKRFPRN